MIGAAVLILLASAAAAGLGAFLKWATLPVILSYELGRAVERVRIGAGRPWRIP